jgi:predicted site-specific integrase-resolvase
MRTESSARPASGELRDTRGLARKLKHTSPRTLERWRTLGTGPRYVKVGRRVLYRDEDIDQWMDQQTRSHTHERVSLKRTGTRRP